MFCALGASCFSLYVTWPTFFSFTDSFQKIFLFVWSPLCYLSLHCSTLPTFLGFFILVVSSVATFFYIIPPFHFPWVSFSSPSHLSKPFLPPIYTLQLPSISFELILFSHQVFSLSLFYGVIPFHISEVSFFFHQVFLLILSLWHSSLPYFLS